jgi:plastocyanin domain-containing protein
MNPLLKSDKNGTDIQLIAQASFQGIPCCQDMWSSLTFDMGYSRNYLFLQVTKLAVLPYFKMAAATRDQGCMFPDLGYHAKLQPKQHVQIYLAQTIPLLHSKSI